MARNFSIVVEGAGRTRKTLDDIEHRLLDLYPAWQEITDVLEEGESRLFLRLHGRYVRTGATRDSLTQRSANGAIRRYYGDAMTFGTSIFYARFLKRPPVLRLQAVERRAAVEVLAYHMRRPL